MKVNPCADVMMRLLNALEASDVSHQFGTSLRDKEQKSPRCLRNLRNVSSFGFPTNRTLNSYHPFLFLLFHPKPYERISKFHAIRTNKKFKFIQLQGRINGPVYKYVKDVEECCRKANTEQQRSGKAGTLYYLSQYLDLDKFKKK